MKIPRIINLPTQTLFRYNFRTAFLLSLIIAITTIFVALAGLVYKDLFYPTNILLRTFVPNDVANLVLGLPLLVLSLFFAQRGKLIGYLCLPGALFYLLYAYIPYLLAVPFSILFLPYLLIVSLSSCTIIYLIAGMNVEIVKQKLEGKAPARLSGGILFGFAILIIIRQVALITAALIKQSPVEMIEISVWISDLAVACPALMAVSLSLWKGKSLGYLAGAGFLLSYGILVVGLIIVIISQAHYTQSSVNISDIAVLVIMAAICFWPFTFFAKAALSKTKIDLN